MTKSIKKRHSPPKAAPKVQRVEVPSKEKSSENSENKRHKEDFEQLLDDAVLGVKRN